MKLFNAFSILGALRICFMATVGPTLKAIIATPSLVLRPRELSGIFFYNVWVVFGHSAGDNNRATKEILLTPNAKGVVLDLGAGLGPTVTYLDRKNVTRYIALEPNVLMHPHIKGAAEKAGFFEEDGSLLILSYGAEDYKGIASALGGAQTVDTIISVLTLCSVPEPEQTITNLASFILKPGGELLFLEHVASQRSDVRFWQGFWTPIWKLFLGGCNLNRPTDVYLMNIPCWEPVPAGGRDSKGGVIGILADINGEEEEDLLNHHFGRLIKRV